MTVEIVVWTLLVIAYAASTIPLAREGWKRTPAGKAGARVYEISRQQRRRARQAA